MAKQKTMAKCHPDKPNVAFGQCERCYRNSEDRNWKRNLKSYDPTLTKEEIDFWINQKKTGSCEICGSKENLFFDHDHETKKMRGILCLSCNSLLGHSDDLPDRLVAAKNYLHAKLPKPKPVEVIWNDAQDSIEPWVGEADAKGFAEEPCPIISIGYLVRKTDTHLVLAADWNNSNKDYGRVTKIPAGMVVKMRDLETEPDRT